MNAAWPRLTWPVRMIRCSDTAAIAVMHNSTPTWCRNLSSVSHGQPSSAITASRMASRLRLTSGLRGAEETPRPHDQEQDDDAERQEGRRGGAVEGADEALGEAQQRAAERGAGDRAHAAQDDDDERHHERALAQERRHRIDL